MMVMSKARRRWKLRSCHMKQVLTHEVNNEMKTSPKVKLYGRAFHFTGQDATQCMIRFRIDRCTIKREL